MKTALKSALFVASLATVWWVSSASSPGPVTRVITKTVEVAAPPPEKIEVSRQAMLRALEGKLEVVSASMRLEKYVTGGVCKGNAWQHFAYENCVAMLVPVKINAGFDWSNFSEDQIETNSEQVIIHLPEPRILGVEILPEDIDVLYQGDGAFVSRDETLQTRTLAAAKRSFVADACRNNIHETAALSAEKRLGGAIRTLLRSVGDTREVVIPYDLPQC